MVAALHDMQTIWHFHLCSDAREKIQRAKRIASALYEENRCGQRAQNFIAEFCAVAHRAKRVSETNQSFDLLFERHMASDATTHAFANQDGWSGWMSLSRVFQCVSMCVDQLRQSIRTFSALTHVIVIERLDVGDMGQTTLPILHPWMR